MPMRELLVHLLLTSVIALWFIAIYVGLAAVAALIYFIYYAVMS